MIGSIARAAVGVIGQRKGSKAAPKKTAPAKASMTKPTGTKKIKTGY